MCGHQHAHKRFCNIADHNTDEPLDISGRFYAPGFWVVAASYARAVGLGEDSIRIGRNIGGYANAIGFLPAACGEPDTYAHTRGNEGQNYSRLVVLESAEAVDTANSTINSCVRSLFADAPGTYVSRLCEVIGELHDNVWSHGRAPGISMAQKWAVPRTEFRDYYFEFAVADQGIGFLRELNRIGRHEESDIEAIRWCIAEGNTTKPPSSNDWEQRVPSDVINNPFTGIEATTCGQGSHHAGLGLHKLKTLVEVAGGKLWVSSGRGSLYLQEGAPETTREIEPWEGVSIACRFRLSKLKQIAESADSDRVRQIMSGLEGK